MKKIKLLSFLLLAFATVTFTSCLNDDDDDNGLTEAQIAQCLSAVRGSHHGQLIYSVGIKDNKAVIDSVPASWSIHTDSTMTFHSVSSKVLATALDTTTTQNKTIKEAIAASAPVDIDAFIGFIQVTPVEWLINPKTVDYNVEYNGGSHKVSIVFLANSTWSYGVYSASKNIFQLQIVAGAAYVDGKLDTSLLPTRAAKNFVFSEDR